MPYITIQTKTEKQIVKREKKSPNKSFEIPRGSLKGI